ILDCNKCSVMFGNGLRAPTSLIRVTGRRRACWASTTANSCATSSFCVAAPAQRRGATSERAIATSSRQQRAGNSWEYGWRMTATSLRAISPIGLEVYAGLTSTPKSLLPKLLYDATGSSLFEDITRLPEYYLTRTEAAILKVNSAEICALAG